MGNSESARRQRGEAGHVATPTPATLTQRPRPSLLRRPTRLHHRVEVPFNSQTQRVEVPPRYTPHPGATQQVSVSPLGPAAAAPRDPLPHTRAAASAPASERHDDACTPAADTKVTVACHREAVDSTCSSPLIGPRNNTGWIDEGSEPLPAGMAELLDGGDLGGSAGVSRPPSSIAEQALEQALRERQSHSIARVRDWLGSVSTVAGTA